MNILFNIPKLNKSNGGVYQYSLALLKILMDCNLPYKFFVYCINPDEEIIEQLAKADNFELINPKAPVYSRTKNIYFKFFNTTCAIFKLPYRKRRKDVYDIIIENYNIKIAHSPIQAYVPKSSIKNITTIHDVQQLHFPEYFTSAQRAYRAVWYKNAIDNSEVVVSYDHVKKDIIKYFEKPVESIHVILLDMKDLWFEKFTEVDLNDLSHTLPFENFLLYPATTFQHKNHLRLLEVLNEVPEVNIICTGHKTEYFYNVLEPYIKDNNLATRIEFLGIVKSKDLFILYKKSLGVIVPTLYEAGSFPLMESILMEVPVVCSNITSLPNTIGNEEFVFDPYNKGEIKNLMLKLWSSEDFRKSNVANSKRVKERIKNNNSAKKFKELYERMLNCTEP